MSSLDLRWGKQQQNMIYAESSQILLTSVGSESTLPLSGSSQYFAGSESMLGDDFLISMID